MIAQGSLFFCFLSRVLDGPPSRSSTTRSSKEAEEKKSSPQTRYQSGNPSTLKSYYYKVSMVLRIHYILRCTESPTPYHSENLRLPYTRKHGIPLCWCPQTPFVHVPDLPASRSFNFNNATCYKKNRVYITIKRSSLTVRSRKLKSEFGTKWSIQWSIFLDFVTNDGLNSE